MPTRPLNINTLSASTAAMFDYLSTRTWAPNDGILDAGATACYRDEYAKALANGQRIRAKALAAGQNIEDDELARVGARDLARNCLMIAVRSGRLERSGDEHRMYPATRAEWLRITSQPTETTPAVTTAKSPKTTITKKAATKATARSTEAATASPAPRRRTKVLIFGGLSETDGFDTAPLATYDRVHFETLNKPIDMDEFRAEFSTNCVVRYDESAGLYRVDVPAGEGAEQREFIRRWCTDRGIVVHGLRADMNVRRRNLSDLPGDFLGELCVHFSSTSKRTLLRRTETVLKRHFPQNDDLDQQISEWVLEAVGQFDHTRSVPFGAFLNQRLHGWVGDLNRKTYGRAVTDAELRHQRAVSAFMHEHGRIPTDEEMAQQLNQPLTTYLRAATAVAQVQNLRNMHPIEGTTADDADIQIPDATLSDEQVIAEEQTALLSALLTSACDQELDPDTAERLPVNVLGWYSWYATVWGQQTKTEVSEQLGTSIRTMNTHTDRVQARMQARREELV